LPSVRLNQKSSRICPNQINLGLNRFLANLGDNFTGARKNGDEALAVRRGSEKESSPKVKLSISPLDDYGAPTLSEANISIAAWSTTNGIHSA
jgi:hypothetical protein